MYRLFRNSLFVLGCLLLTASVHAQVTYDATADYLAGWNSGSNPNGVWSYGWSTTLLSQLNLYTNTIQSVPFDAWYSPSTGNTNDTLGPDITLNTGPNFNNGNLNILANTLNLTAGGPGVPLYSHIVFSAPTGGLYSIVAGFRGDQYGVNSDVNVLDNGNSLFSTAITSEGQTASYSGTVALAAGQTIDFAFGADGAPSRGPFQTGFSALVTAAPEANTLLSASLLLAGGRLLLRRRRK